MGLTSLTKMIELSSAIVLICILNIAVVTGSTDFQKLALAEHNLLRAMHGSPPLQEDLSLQNEAQKHADYLATTNKFEQNKDYTLIGNIGSSSMRSEENAIKAVMKLWYAGVKHYDFNNPGFISKAGTFTSIVWKSSTKLGIGVALNPTEGSWIIVSYYSPTPNMDGEFQDNVFPLIESIPKPPNYTLTGCPVGTPKAICKIESPEDRQRVQEWLKKMNEWESSLTQFGKTNWKHVYPDEASDMRRKQFRMKVKE